MLQASGLFDKADLLRIPAVRMKGGFAGVPFEGNLCFIAFKGFLFSPVVV